MGAYYYVIKADPTKLEKERERVRSILNNRYNNDLEYREKRKEYSKQYRLRKKQEKQQQQSEQNDIKI